MSDTFRVSGGPAVAMDDGRLVGFGQTFDLDDFSDDALLDLMLASGQITFVSPVLGDGSPAAPPQAPEEN